MWQACRGSNEDLNVQLFWPIHPLVMRCHARACKDAHACCMLHVVCRLSPTLHDMKVYVCVWCQVYELFAIWLQVRLCLDKQDFIRAQILSRKISPKAFVEKKGEAKGEIGIEGTAIEAPEEVGGLRFGAMVWVIELIVWCLLCM